MKVPVLEESNSSNRKESYIKKHYPEFYEFLNEKYSHIDNYKDRISVFLHGLEDVPKCPVCGRNRPLRNIRYGYNTYCSYKCSNMSADKKQKSKATKKERYGDENYNNMDKNKTTCLERYGTSSYTKTIDFKNKVEKTCLNRYGSTHYLKTTECRERSYNTKKKNGTFNSSKIEELFNDYLIANNIEFKRQYKSDLYPFSCDFYIPSKDLYIEIQASWTHGEHPFNENDIEDMKKLKLWQSKGTDYYNNAIYVWTVRDPLKRETAKKNGIKLLEVFLNNISDLIYTFEGEYK